MSAAAAVGYAALCVALAAPAIWAAGYREGRNARCKALAQERDAARAEAYGWRKVALTEMTRP